MEEKDAGKRKRLGIVTLEVITEEENFSDGKGTKETVQVQYPIWDGKHMPASVVKHPDRGIINHTDAQKIAKLIITLITPLQEDENTK